LLLLDVLEHVLAFGEDDEVGEDLRVLVVEAAEFGQSHLGLLLVVGPLQELVDVVQDQVVFEDRDDVRVFVVYQVIHCLHVVVVSVGAVFLAERVLDDHAELVMRAEDGGAWIHSETSRVHSESLIAEGALLGRALR
jgi:hypothetical protein